MIRHKSPQSGFTLVEAALVVVIGGMLLSAAASALNAYLQELKIQTTQNRMKDIDNAIIGYLNINGVLPCVAAMTTPQDSLTFGVEVTQPGGNLGKDCAPFATGAAVGAWTVNTAGGAFPPAPPPPAGTGILTPPLNLTATTIIIGAVPVRTLNLPDQDIADAWGNRFTYAVTDNLTMLTPANGYDQTQGAISVIDSNGKYLAPSDPATSPGIPLTLSDTNPAAQYVIVSYGAAGAGAYTLGGAVPPVPCPGAASLEYTNCALSTTNTFRSAPLNSDKTAAGYFDDYVIFHSLIAPPATIPYGMIMPFALPGGCPPGWSDYVAPLQIPSATPISCTATCIPSNTPVCPPLPPYIFCCVKQ